MNINEVKRNLNDIAEIRSFLKDGGTEGLKSEDPQCDKVGFGFNEDSRFSAFATSVSLDSWKGYFGNSSCYKVINVSHSDVFSRALVAWLNKNIEKVMFGVCEIVEKECAKEVTEIRAESEKLKKIADDLESITKENT